MPEQEQWYVEGVEKIQAVLAERDRYREALDEIRERWAYPKLVALVDEVLGERQDD